MTRGGDSIGFLRGLAALPRAVRVIFRAPQTVLWLVPPLLITLLLDALAFWFSFDWLRSKIEGSVPGGGWLGWLRPVLDVLGALIVIFVLAWSFTALFLALTSPFQDYVSAAVERHVRGFASEEPRGLAGFLRSIGQSLAQAIWLTLLGIVFLLLGFVPVIGPALVFLWGAFALGYAFVAVPSGRIAHGLAQRRAFARQHLGAILGLGAPVFLCSFVPLLNVVLMPIFVVAGTLLYLEAVES